MPGEFYFFVTVTPPGTEPHCKKAGCKAAPLCRHEQCPCTPWGGVDLAEWNPTAGKRWNRLLLLIERHYGARPEYFRPVETQGRGGLHKHPLMRTTYALDERVFRRLAIEAGFGHEVRVIRVDKGSGALAQYVTKAIGGYVTKSADDRSSVPWRTFSADPETGEAIEHTKATYRTWSQSRGWGVTMREIRARMKAKALEIKAAKIAAVEATIPTSAAGVVVDCETPPAPS